MLCGARRYTWNVASALMRMRCAVMPITTPSVYPWPAMMNRTLSPIVGARPVDGSGVLVWLRSAATRKVSVANSCCNSRNSKSMDRSCLLDMGCKQRPVLLFLCV